MKKENRTKLVEILRQYKFNNRMTDLQLSDVLEVPIATCNAWMRGSRTPSNVAATIILEFLDSECIDVSFFKNNLNDNDNTN